MSCFMELHQLSARMIVIVVWKQINGKIRHLFSSLKETNNRHGITNSQNINKEFSDKF